MTRPCNPTGDPRLVGDPVNVITGANTDRGLDFRLEGPLPLEWFRYYDSGKAHMRRSLGWGHGHEFDRWLRFDLDGMRYLGADGNEIAFPFLEEDGARETREGHVLERVEKGLYRVRQGSRPVSEFRFHAFDRPVPVTRVFLGAKEIVLKYGNGLRLESVIDSLGRWIEVKYDEAARTQTFHLHEVLGKPSRPILGYKFDEAGNLLQGVDPYRNAFSFRYDARNLMTARTDRRGYTFFYEYDSKGRCHRSYGEDGVEEVNLRYTDGEGVTEVVRGDGGKWTYFHDETGFLYQIIDPYGGVKAFKADEDKKVTEEIDPNGNVTKVVYDEAGNAVGKVSPFGRFAPMGAELPNPLEHRVPATPIQFELGDLLAARDIQAPTWRSKSVEALPALLQRHFRIVPRPLPEPGQTQAEAEAATLAGLAPYKAIRDPHGQLTKETAPGRPARAWAYDKNGNVSAYRDLDGSVTRCEYQSWNHLRKVIDPLGREVRYEYDVQENLTAVVDTGGTRSDYDYDLKGRMVRVRRHGKVREEYVYDSADNLVEKKDGQGRTLLALEVGKGNQLAVRRLASGDTHTFKYDAHGRYLEAVTEAAAEAGPDGPRFKVTFAYDKAGNRAEDLRDGLGARHAYEGLDLVETVLLDRFKVAYKRRKEGQLAIRLPHGKDILLKHLGDGLFLKEMPNSSREWVQYDGDGRILSKVASGPERYDQEWVRRYTYSDDGDLLEEVDTRYGSVGYAYDATHRLKSETLPNGRQLPYVFDNGDNLLGKPGLSGVSLLEGNRLAAANGDAFEYDDRNHLSVRRGHWGETRYTYDSRGFLTGIEGPDLRWSATYDPLGRRVTKTVNGGTYTFHWDSDRLVAETDPAGKLRLYIYPDAFSMVPVAFLDYASASADPASAKAFFVFSNHLGAPTLVEDADGHTVWSARLEPYGQAQLALGKGFHMPLRWAGHYWDEESGLHYNRFRYYSPELGRYLQSDPEGIYGGLNLYGYAEGNPLRWVDVRGLQCPVHKVVSDPDCADCQNHERTKTPHFDTAINDPDYPTLKLNPQTGKTDPKSGMEAVSALEAKATGKLPKDSSGKQVEIERVELAKGDIDKDFKVKGSNPTEYVEIKTPIDPNLSHLPPKQTSLTKQAKDIAGHITKDKTKYPTTKITWIVDLRNLSTPQEKADFKTALKNEGVDISQLTFINE